MSCSDSVPTLKVALLPAATVRWYNHVSCAWENTTVNTLSFCRSSRHPPDWVPSPAWCR